MSDEYFISDLVLTGTVMASRSIVDPTDPDGTTGTFYTVRADAVYRGRAPKSLKVYSENTSARFPMEARKLYLLFLTKNSNKDWVVDNCGNSGEVSLNSSAMEQLKRLPLRQSFIYGEVYSWSNADYCAPMHLTLHSSKDVVTTTVKADCSFEADVPPGRYEAILQRNGVPIAANDLNYKDVYCFVVPAGGSAGIAFRLPDGADEANRKFLLENDRRARSLCSKSRAPAHLF